MDGGDRWDGVKDGGDMQAKIEITWIEVTWMEGWHGWSQGQR